MNEVIEKSKMDLVKWSFTWLILASGLFANYYFSTMSVPIRLIGWLLLLLVIFGIISQTQKGRRWWAFIEEAKNELRKIVWPTRPETIQTTAVVVLMVVVAALFLWATDVVLMQAIQFFTGTKG